MNKLFFPDGFDFDEPLSVPGDVSPIDIRIPVPGAEETADNDPESGNEGGEIPGMHIGPVILFPQTAQVKNRLLLTVRGVKFLTTLVTSSNTAEEKTMKPVLMIVVTFVLYASGLSAQVLSPFVTVSSDSGMQGWIQVAYNTTDDEYFVVWEDYRNDPRCDIYGRRVQADGTPIGESFAICDLPGSQKYWPHLDFDPFNNRYLVVFEDSRNGNNDVYGCLLNADGTKVWTDSSETDTCFAISKHPSSSVYAPTVSFLPGQGRYLVVWADLRNGQYRDVYGQIVDAGGRLLPPSDAAHPDVNFAVASDGETSQNVPFVSTHPDLNEWLVVFGNGLGIQSRISAQRVDPDGRLLMQDGSPGSEWISISDIANLHHDWTQPRAQFNSEPFYGELRKSAVNGGSIECLIAWNTKAVSEQLDVHGQRLAYIPDSDAVRMGFREGTAEDGRFYALFADMDGGFSADTRSNFVISDAPGAQNACDLAYSVLDDEWFVAWGDRRRDTGWTGRISDLYGQRIARQEDGRILLLNGDRTAEVSSS
ncbi:MAG TPA: hypothetical protein ENN17_07940 [bacterium]|nr:hypothetical protein [bacterium]